MITQEDKDMIEALGNAAGQLAQGAAALASQKAVIDEASVPLKESNYSGGTIQSLVTTAGTVSGLCARVAEAARDRMKAITS